MRLSDLLGPVSGGDPEIAGIADDSRVVGPGDLFVLRPGAPTAYLAAARAAGAVAAIVPPSVPSDLPGAVWSEERYRRDLGPLAHRVLGDPTRAMAVFGVTGTNGKTTVAWMLRDALNALGNRAAYLGTLGFGVGTDLRPLANTTPFPVELARLARGLRDEGADALAMEVSSHALDQGRVAGVAFRTVVFTNLTQDHLDYHGTMAAYEAAKRRLFGTAGDGLRRAVNVGDPVGARWHAEDPAFADAVPFARSGPPSVVTAERVTVRLDRIEGEIAHRDERVSFEIALGGAYHVENLLAVVAALIADGRRLGELAPIFPALRPVPGRFEAVPNERGIIVLVDYAHTPDALAKVLAAARTPDARTLVVFGCGGDRDRTKRPLMARAAQDGADVVIVTSDNPRSEDPSAIVRDVAAGLTGPHEVVLDRREAIHRAVNLARPGDVVVIAGKGHETYQIVGDQTLPFDDRAVAREALA